MSLKFNELEKSGLAETDTQNRERLNGGLQGKKAGSASVFQALLNIFKPEGGSAPPGGLRSRPPSSRIIGAVQSGTSPGKSIRSGTVNSHGVNTMAASTLIALAAVSSGGSCLEGFCGHGAAMPSGLSRLVSNAVRAYATEGSAGSNPQGQEIGALSARFESGEQGPAAVGYDERGGTSYGTYQISSRAGTMKLFLDYLSQSAPDLAQKLEAAGPANTGGCSGQMPKVWKEIAAADSVRFEKLQTAFIKQSIYNPAAQEIFEKTGLDISKAPKALQEVLWSTAVQHGAKGAADIFAKAVGAVVGQNDQVGVANLIGAVYNARSGRFASSGPGVRAAVMNRFRQEGKMALAMLSNETSNTENAGA